MEYVLLQCGTLQMRLYKPSMHTHSLFQRQIIFTMPEGSPPGILQNGPTETPLSLEVWAGSLSPRQRHLQRSSFQSIFLSCRNSCRQLWKPLLKIGGNKDRQRAGFQNMSLNRVQDSLELQQELCGHTDRVWSVAWSPAGLPPHFF